MISGKRFLEIVKIHNLGQLIEQDLFVSLSPSRAFPSQEGENIHLVIMKKKSLHHLCIGTYLKPENIHVHVVCASTDHVFL